MPVSSLRTILAAGCTLVPLLTAVAIDRSFVREVCSSREAKAIVRAVTTLGNSLDMVITAEGVEHAEQLQTLLELGCDQAQGYYLSTPRPLSEVEAMLPDRGLRLIAARR